MKIITNEELIKTRIKWTRWVSFGGMGCLIVGFIVNLYSIGNPTLSTVAFVLLLIGMAAAVASSHLARNWIQEPRADQFLSDMLKKFGNDYVLFNYTVGTANLLLTPTRLYVILVRSQDGQVTVRGDRFKQKFQWRHIFRIFSTDGMGAPLREAERNIEMVRDLLSEELSSEEVPEITPLVAFSNKDTTLILEEPALPIVQHRAIREYLKQHNKETLISREQRSRLIEILGGDVVDQSSKEK